MTSALIPVVLFGALAAGCSYKAVPAGNPPSDVYSSYEEPVPGHFTLLVDDEAMLGTFQVPGYTCSLYSYPLDARTAFSDAVTRTVERVVESADPAPSAGLNEESVALGGRGVIRVKGEGLDVDLRVASGFLSGQMEAQVAMTASVQVDGPEGRLFGSTVSGEGRERAGTGLACAGGAVAVREAAEKALETLSRQLAEGISNAPRLRTVHQTAVEPAPPLTTAAGPGEWSVDAGLYCVSFGRFMIENQPLFPSIVGPWQLVRLEEIRSAAGDRLMAEMSLEEIGRRQAPLVDTVHRRYAHPDVAAAVFADDLDRCSRLLGL
jgi:hypothetical protein